MSREGMRYGHMMLGKHITFISDFPSPSSLLLDRQRQPTRKGLTIRVNLIHCFHIAVKLLAYFLLLVALP